MKRYERPSTHGGNLTYPYYPRLVDRGLYAPWVASEERSPYHTNATSGLVRLVVPLSLCSLGADGRLLAIVLQMLWMHVFTIHYDGFRSSAIPGWGLIFRRSATRVLVFALALLFSMGATYLQGYTLHMNDQLAPHVGIFVLLSFPRAVQNPILHMDVRLAEVQHSRHCRIIHVNKFRRGRHLDTFRLKGPEGPCPRMYRPGGCTNLKTHISRACCRNIYSKGGLIYISAGCLSESTVGIALNLIEEPCSESTEPPHQAALRPIALLLLPSPGPGSLRFPCLVSRPSLRTFCFEQVC